MNSDERILSPAEFAKSHEYPEQSVYYYMRTQKIGKKEGKRYKLYELDQKKLEKILSDLPPRAIRKEKRTRKASPGHRYSIASSTIAESLMIPEYKGVAIKHVIDDTKMAEFMNVNLKNGGLFEHEKKLLTIAFIAGLETVRELTIHDGYPLFKFIVPTQSDIAIFYNTVEKSFFLDTVQHVMDENKDVELSKREIHLSDYR